MGWGWTASTHLEVGKKGVRGKGVAGERGGRSGVGFRRSDKELGVLAGEVGGLPLLAFMGESSDTKGAKGF